MEQERPDRSQPRLPSEAALCWSSPLYSRPKLSRSHCTLPSPHCPLSPPLCSAPRRVPAPGHVPASLADTGGAAAAPNWRTAPTRRTPSSLRSHLSLATASTPAAPPAAPPAASTGAASRGATPASQPHPMPRRRAMALVMSSSAGARLEARAVDSRHGCPMRRRRAGTAGVRGRTQSLTQRSRSLRGHCERTHGVKQRLARSRGPRVRYTVQAGASAI